MISRLKMGNDKDTYMPVYIKDNDRYLSVLVVGRPGSGKSVAMEHWWFSDCMFPTAKIAIDPSGYLARNLYSISEGNALYWSIDRPIPLNPLFEPYSPIQLADNLIEVVNQTVTLTTPNEKFTVKMRELLTDTTLWCLKHNRRSIEAIRDVLATQKGHAETRDGIIARLDMLLQDEQLKQTICGHGTINWKRFIEKGKSLILDCFGISRDKMIFVGCIITHAIKSYFRYTRLKDPKPLVMYIDEAHNFINHNHLDILKEGRKYRLSAILCTQDFTNVDNHLVKTMLSNIGTIVALSCGSLEASMISREFPTFQVHDIQFLEKYHAAVKTPDGESIVKLPRPLLVKQVELKPIEAKRRTFDLTWFDLPSCYDQWDYDPADAAAGDEHNHALKTLPVSTEGG